MKLKNQCVSLELAKKLKELKVKQDSLFYWYNSMASNGEWIICDKKGFKTDIKILLKQGNLLSAFTIAELGEMLPDLDPIAKSGDIEYYFSSTKLGNSGYWTCGYGNKKVFIQEETEANARAKMLIYLIKNKLI